MLQEGVACVPVWGLLQQAQVRSIERPVVELQAQWRHCQSGREDAPALYAVFGGNADAQ